METLFNLFLWGVAAALAFGPLGACFGAVVRTTLFLGGKASESTLGQAIVQGLCSGGLFLGVFGFLVGCVIGWQEPDIDQGLPSLLGLLGGAFALMLLAGAFAGMASLWLWLGVNRTCFLLGLVIAATFINMVAPPLSGISLVLNGICLAAFVWTIADRIRTGDTSNVETAEGMLRDWSESISDRSGDDRMKG